MTMEFFQTAMGHQFYERTIPRIAKALEKIAEKLDTGIGTEQAAVECETWCENCGAGVPLDEDLCCFHCGAEAEINIDRVEALTARVSELETEQIRKDEMAESELAKQDGSQPLGPTVGMVVGIKAAIDWIQRYEFSNAMLNSDHTRQALVRELEFRMAQARGK